MSIYKAFSGPYFPALRLNTERNFVTLRIQSKYGKIRTRKNSVFGHFSRSDKVEFSRSDKVQIISKNRYLICTVYYDPKYFLHLNFTFLNFGKKFPVNLSLTIFIVFSFVIQKIKLFEKAVLKV